MFCKYRFPVIGRMRLAASLGIPSSLGIVQFETNATGMAHHVHLLLPMDDRSQWPLVEPDPTPGVKMSFKIRYPHLEEARALLRTIEGLLSLYGLEGIATEDPEIEWIPESDEEREALSLISLKRRRTQIPDEHLPALSFDLLARSVLAAPSCFHLETRLNFIRKGSRDIRERRFIDSIYIFYFLFESAFAEGKTKNYAVKNEMKSSEVFRSAIEKVSTRPASELSFDKKIQIEFSEKYAGMDADEVIDGLVELRGFLHHHSTKRKGIWHPNLDADYQLDALFYQAIALNVVFAMTEEHVFSEEVRRKYIELFDIKE